MTDPSEAAEREPVTPAGAAPTSSDAPTPTPPLASAAEPVSAAPRNGDGGDGPAGDAGPRRLPLWRRILVGVLVVLVCILVPISVVGVWMRNTLLHTDQYVDTMAPLAHNTAIQQAVANRVTTALIEGTDLEDKVANALPRRAKVAAPFIVGGAEQVIHTAALRVAESDQFADLWRNVNRRAHAKVVAVLKGEGTDSVSTKKGEIVLQLGPIAEKVADALENTGVGFFQDLDTSRVDREIVLFQSEDLRKAQGAVSLLDDVANYLPFVALALFVIAVVLSGNRRRTILRTALGIALGMGILLTIFNLGRTVYLDALPASVNEQAATAVYDQVLSFLRTSLRTVFVLALLVALGAWLSGPSRLATRIRHAARREPTEGAEPSSLGTWVGRYRNVLRVLVVAAGLILLVVLNHPSPGAVLVVAVLVVIGLLIIELLGRNVPAEAAA
jgi:hypothetical protein